MFYLNAKILYKKCSLLICSCLLSIFCLAQKPTANFSASTQQGCAPLIVQFNDLSTNNPTQWNWDLGNGVISTQQNPATSYLISGIYTIKLIATNADGSDTIIQTNYIIVHDQPTASFTASATTGCFPLTVQFNSTSVANSGTLTEWFWDFGDGSTSTQENPQHTYTVAGSFTVSLKVKNSKGCFKQISNPNFINIASGVQANFAVISTSGCTLPVNIGFNNTSSGTGTLTYEWDFGDGSTSTQTNPFHSYTNNGSYTVKLIVKNNNGCTDTIIKPSIVNVGSVNADFNFTGHCQNSTIIFTNTSSPTPISNSWDFGDGTTSTQANPQKIFTTAKNYQVKLIADFGTCKDTVIKSVLIDEKPIAAFTNTPTGGCIVPLSVNFTTAITGVTAYQWDFGDGGTSTQQNPTYQYLQQGSYHVKLMIENAAGCRDTITKNNAVVITQPQINNFSHGAPFSGCAPYTNNFSINVTTTDSIANYEWDFGDGTPIETGKNPTHTYFNTGFYNIKVIITTVNGCKDTFSLNNAISLYEKPSANFTATPLNACANDVITFTNLSSANATSWYWTFGDGGFSVQQNPLHNYTDTGWFTVRLIVANVSCRDTLQMIKLVRINPPIARFNQIVNCDSPMVRVFQNESIGALTYLWDFGDGTTSTDSNAVHTYTALGNYNVVLSVTNGACTHTDTAQVIIADLNTSIATADTAICKYATTVFNATNTTTSTIANYTWNFGDGTIISGNNLATITHVYNDTGNKSPTLIVTDLIGCNDTVSLFPPLIIYGPKANFANTAGTCVNGTINFTDNSTTDGVHNITQVIWFYGDGSSDTLTASPYMHQYTDTGYYHVKLKVIDDFGCYDTSLKYNAVQITKPIANFFASDTIRCANSAVQFNNTSLGYNLQYVWNFGDGDTSIIKNPSHAYTTQGLYSVNIKVVDKFGCIDTLLKPLYINVANSVADFSFIQGDTLGLCYPYLIQVANNSLNTTNISWSFGDGGFSNLDMPFHTYNYVGTYTLKLKTFGYGGCVDSVQKNIVVRGPTGTFTYSPLQFCSPTVVNFIGHTQSNAFFIWDFADGVINTTFDSVLSHTYTTPGIYKPNMILIDSIGCQVTIAGVDTIKVAGVETFIKVPQTQFCDSVLLNLMDSTIAINDTITQYLWTFGDGTSSTQKNPQHFYTQTGNYAVTLKVTTSLGCNSTDTLQTPINVVKTPAIAINGINDVCIFDSLQYQATIIASDTNTLYWLWNFDNGNTANTQIPSLQTYQTAGNYTITTIVKNDVGCADTVQKNIVVHPLPNIDAGNNIVICGGSNTTLNATGGNTYIWATDSSLSCLNCQSTIATPDSSIIYKVTGISNVGCKKVDSVLVEVIQPFTLSISSNDTLCIGSSVPIAAFGNADNFSWQPTTGLNNPNIKNPIAAPTQTTVYAVIATDNNNCFKDTATVEIKVYPIPQINIIESFVQANVGTTIPLLTTNSSDVTNWRWVPQQWLNCYNCPAPIATVTDKIKYVVEASNPGGCFARDEITIEPLCNNYNVYIPNTFSPNGDGVNDIFYTRGKGLFSVRSMKIYNRWGELVFNKLNIAANNPFDGWDGTYQGKNLSSDVYVYVIEVVCDNSQSMVLKGNIMLLR